MKTFVKLALFAVILWNVPDFCHGKTEGFTLARIASKLPYHAEWEVKGNAKEPLAPIFDQKFTYLSAGGQSFVFASEDGRYVLKFFKQHRMRMRPLLGLLPLPPVLSERREKIRAKKTRRLYRDFGSYKLAFEELPKETELVYVHLNKTKDLNLTATIVDKLNIAHKVNLDKHEFVVQRRAEPAYPYFRKLIANGEIDRAKKALESLCNLVRNRCDKGIYDEDANVRRNIGFFDETAIIIDVGRLKWDTERKKQEVQEKDLIKLTDPFIEFLNPLSPELSVYLQSLRREV